MTARQLRGKGNGWYVDFVFKHAGGFKERVRKISPVNTKRGAEEYERQLRTEMLDPTRKEVKRIRFAKFADEFREVWIPKKKHATRISYRSILRVHLVPEFGGMWVDEIDSKRIQTFEAGLRLRLEAKRAKRKQQPDSGKTMRNIKGVLSKALHVAHDWGHIRAVPAIEFESVKPTRFRHLDDVEVPALLNHAGDYWRMPVLTGLKGGLRMGELWAMEREQVLLSQGKLHIDRAVYRGVVGLPKHDKIRTVDIPPSLVEALRAHLTVVPLHCRLVFPTRDGRMRNERKADRGLRRAAARGGIEPFGWHVLRHTYASRLTMLGTAPKALMELLGHADLTETMRYSHLAPSFKAEAVARLDAWPGQCARSLSGGGN